MSVRPTALDNLQRKSEAFAGGEEMAVLLDALLDDRDLRTQAQREPDAVLRERRIRPPRGTQVKFAQQPRPTKLLSRATTSFRFD